MRVIGWVHKVLLVLAAPVAFWTSFEMYLLTIAGPQMLGYSVVHAYPTILAMNYFSAPFFLVLAIYNCVLLALILTKLIYIVPPLIPGSVLLFQNLHVLALLTYEHWAHSWLRVFICLIGLIMLVGVTIICIDGGKLIKARLKGSE